MDNLTPSDHGKLGVYAKHPKSAWTRRGIRPKVRRTLDKIASRAVGVRPGPKTGDDDLRSNQPETEISCTEYIESYAPIAQPSDGFAQVYPTVAPIGGFRRSPFRELQSTHPRKLAQPGPEPEPQRRWRIASNA